MRLSFLLPAIVAAQLIGAAALDAQPAEYVVLAVPGADQTLPYGVNNQGHVVGMTATCSPFSQRGFIYRDGEYSIIDVPGSIGTHPRGINNRGVVVGYFYTPDFLAHGFRFWRGQYEVLSLPGTNVFAFDINNRGDIVGGMVQHPTQQAFLLSQRGDLTIIPGPPGTIGMLAYGIDTSGTVVGTGFTAAESFSFIYRKGELTTLPNTILFDINDRGDVLAWPVGEGPGVYRKGERLALAHPDEFYLLTGLSNTHVVGVGETESADGCLRTQGFRLRLR